MANKIRLYFLAACLLIFAGCASMSADECRNADWRAIGYEDGDRGHSVDHLARHRKACAKIDVTPDLEAYEAGRQQGLRLFCNPRRGYAAGTKGYEYNGVCPAEMEDAFIDAYEQGRTLFELENELRRTENDISKMNEEIDILEDDIADAEDRLINDQNDAEGRKNLLASIKDMNHQRDDLIFDLHHIQSQLEDRQRDVDEYKRRAPNY